MTEVITLSDDDDVIPLTPKSPVVLRTSSTANHADKSLGATAHIATVSKLNLEQLGIRKLAEVYNRNHQSLSKSNEGSLALTRYNFPPHPATPNAYSPYAGSILKRRSLSPAVPHAIPSFQRTRNNPSTSATSKIYNGHYMFEATESFEPSRRSSRFNVKKVEGKFVCTYNTATCFKLCGSVVGFINHLWSHIVCDPPLPAMQKKEAIENRIIIPKSTTDFAPLSNNSVLALRKMQTCEFCNAVFKTVHMKQQHVSKCHIEPDTSPSACNICELDFENTPGFEAHKRKHTAGDAPYNCKKCKYRTSVRVYFYQHFIDRHINETLLCPICLLQEDLRPTTRRSKHIFVNSFVDHLRLHATSAQFRCHMCALTYNNRADLESHRIHDHSFLNPLWMVNERPKIKDDEKEMMSIRTKISILQRKFFETPEGRRITDEVACIGDVERMGYDLTSTGSTLFQCDCGFKSYNGNRTASHFHRCRKPIQDIEREQEIIRNSGDPKDELEIFAVYPKRTSTEVESECIQEVIFHKLRLVKDDPSKLRTENIVYEPIDDLLLLKTFSNGKDKSSEIIAECIAKVLGNST